ncbi:MAG: hypothetical protein V1838_04255, partial [Patescibacteria group bacterium]
LKKAILIVALLVATMLIVLALYYVFFRSEGIPTNDNVNGMINGQLPNTNAITNRPVTDLNANITLPGDGTPYLLPPDEVATGRETIAQTLVPEGATNMTLGPSGNDLQYYDIARGQFYRLSADGKTKQLLSPNTFAQVQNVTWTPNGNMAIMEFPDDSKILYDFSRSLQVTLPLELEDFSFSPDSNKMVFKFLGATAEDQWLAVANPDGSDAKIVEVLGDQADHVESNWSPNQQVVATYSKSVSLNQQEIIFLGQDNENFKSLTVNGRGFSGQWSPSGELMLYSVYNDLTNYNPVLNITQAKGDSIGQNNYSLDVQTWPDKCVFGTTGSSVICAVPTFMPSGSGLHPELATGQPDELYEIDLSTGYQRLLARPVADDGVTRYTMTNMRLSESGDKLFFVEATTGELLSVRLR